MAEPRSFLDVIRDLNIGPRGLSPSAYSRVGSAEQARQAQTALENRPAPTPLTIPNIDVGRGSLQAARMSAAADPVVQQMSASLAPVPQTVSDSVSRNLVKALNTGSSNANRITEADRKADMTKTLMGGDMQAFMQNLLAQQNPTPPRVAPPRAAPPKVDPPQSNFISNLLRMFAQPEFQQAGFAGQGFGPIVLGATRALRAMETQDIEAAKLQAAADKEALEQAAAARAEERALRGLDIQQQRADIARSTAEQDRIRAANITGPKIDSFVQAIKGNKTFIESIDSLTGGNFLQRLAPGVQGGPSREDVVRAVALEAANVSNQNPRLSTPDAIKQAIANIKGGGSAPTQSTNNNGVDPFANVGG